MKRKTRSPSSVRGYRVQFDDTEFLLLAFVAVALLAFVAWQTRLLPAFITNSLILGASTIR